MRVSDLWRNKYDALLKENIKLRERNILLSKQLVGTIVALIVSVIYSFFKSFSQ